MSKVLRIVLWYDQRKFYYSQRWRSPKVRARDPGLLGNIERAWRFKGRKSCRGRKGHPVLWSLKEAVKTPINLWEEVEECEPHCTGVDRDEKFTGTKLNVNWGFKFLSYALHNSSVIFGLIQQPSNFPVKKYILERGQICKANPK